MVIDKDTKKLLAKLTPWLLDETDSNKVISGLLREIQASRDDFTRLEKKYAERASGNGKKTCVNGDSAAVSACLPDCDQKRESPLNGDQPTQDPPVRKKSGLQVRRASRRSRSVAKPAKKMAAKKQ